jgi:hypothetical protein
MEATTALCRECNKRFPLSRHSNRFGRAGSIVRNSRFCTPACRQAAYRKRNGPEGKKPASGTTPLRAVTRESQAIEKTRGIRAPKTALEIEIWGQHRWEDRISSGGVPIQVGRLRQSALVRP